ncbi:MAG: efflux RND transporter permease subunit [Pseudomonadota bacterium]
MNLTAFAIHRNRVTLVVSALLLLSGAAAFVALPKAQDPGFTVRTAVVTTRLPGANPERVELLVTDTIEEKIQEMPEIDTIVSESRTGISIITVNFLESYTEMRPIFDELRRKVEDVERDLPQGVRGPFVNDEFGDVFGSVYALRGDGFSNAELHDIAEDLRDSLLKDPDIAKVTIHGAEEERIFVEYENARLAELGLSPRQLSSALSSANILSSGGDIVSGRERIVLEPTGNYESVAELGLTVVQLPDGNVLYLRDIATIRRGYADPPESITRINGRRGLALAIAMRDGGDILKLGRRLDERIPELLVEYPWGIDLEKIWFQAALVRTNVNNFLSSLGQAIAIVVAVIVLFLGLRTGLVVATLIPAAMLMTFYVMQVFGITVNQISLAALIIALGLLVDNAIVIVESILVKREAGTGTVQAAAEAGAELKTPLLVSSLTTAAAFMPIALAESAVGEYTADIFYVVTIALLLSWLLAMTLLPLLTTRYLRVSARGDGDDVFDNRWYAAYRRLLLTCLRHRGAFGIGVVAVFVLALQGLGLVRQEFIAPNEDPVFTGKLEMPIGTAIEASEAVVAAIDDYVGREFYGADGGPVRNWLSFIGDGGPRFMLGLDPPNPNPANTFLIVNTVDDASADAVIEELRRHVFETQPDLNTQIRRLENGPPVGYPIQIRVSGDDIEALYRIAADITGLMYAAPGVLSVKNSWGMQTKKLLVDVDQERARRAGVSSEDVAFSLQASLSGVDMTEYREGDTLIPVTLRTVEADRRDISKLDGMAVYSQSTGRAVPLKQVADVRLMFETGMIERRDRSRTISLLGQLEDGATAAEVNAELLPAVDELAAAWPNEYSYEVGGEAESSGDANASIAAKLPLALMAVLLLLVTQFNSLRKPLIVLATIPLGLIGVTAGLLVANSTFGFFTILGIISLSGIIINNAIVLLDRIEIEYARDGVEHDGAVVGACLQRARPIVLTTATTVLGMLPLLWGGNSMFRPMAISIIAGLLFATVLTLFVVPVLYSLLYRVRFA